MPVGTKEGNSQYPCVPQPRQWEAAGAAFRQHIAKKVSQVKKPIIWLVCGVTGAGWPESCLWQHSWRDGCIAERWLNSQGRDFHPCKGGTRSEKSGEHTERTGTRCVVMHGSTLLWLGGSWWAGSRQLGFLAHAARCSSWGTLSDWCALPFGIPKFTFFPSLQKPCSPVFSFSSLKSSSSVLVPLSSWSPLGPVGVGRKIGCRRGKRTMGP